MSRVQLSKNFFLDEFTRSETAARAGIEIHVAQGSDIYKNLERLCNEILQPLRDALGPVHITSGYRPANVNKLIGGSRNSQHKHGLASDFVVSGYTPLQAAQYLEPTTNYDQLIHEFGRWVHVSIPKNNKQRRGQTLTAFKKHVGETRKLKTCYVSGLMTIAEARQLK